MRITAHGHRFGCCRRRIQGGRLREVGTRAMSNTEPPGWDPPSSAAEPPETPAPQEPTGWPPAVGNTGLSVRSRPKSGRTRLLLLGAGVVLLIVGIAIGTAISGDTGSTDSQAPVASDTETTPDTGAPVVTTTVPVETLKAQLLAGVEKNCQGMVTLQFDSVVPYDDAWAPTGITEDQYAQLAAKCVTDRTKALADGAGPVDVDGMIKNPDAFKGKFFKLYAEISQYDAATGACAFRGSWDNQTHEYSFDYAGDNAYFTGGDGDTACPELNGIDQDDVVRLWVRTDGAYTYETTMGGSITVPSFHVVRAEVVQKK